MPKKEKKKWRSNDLFEEMLLTDIMQNPPLPLQRRGCAIPEQNAVLSSLNNPNHVVAGTRR